MTHEDARRERLIEALAYQPRHIINGIIRVADMEPATLSSIKRKSKPSASLGTLDALPLEIIHTILGVLDCQAL